MQLSEEEATMNMKLLNRNLAVALLAAFCGVAAAAMQKNDQADVLLQAAIHKETVEGNLEQAIGLYKDIVAKYSRNRAVAAAALLHMGQAYEKLGSTEARKAYERIAREFSDQTDVASDANRRLASLSKSENPGTPRTSESLTIRRLWTAPSNMSPGNPSS